MNKKFVALLEDLDIVAEGFAGAIADHEKKTKAQRDAIEKVCDCTGNGRSLKKSSHDANCAAIKKGLVTESKLNKTQAYKLDSEKNGEFYVDAEGDDWGVFGTESNGFCYSLCTSKAEANRIAKEMNDRLKESLDEGRGRPKKDRSNEEPKVAGKRGRPKKDDIYDAEDDEEKEGKRDLTLHAFIRGGKGKNKQEAIESKTIKSAKVDDIKKLVQDFENVLTVKFANKWDFDEDEIFVDVKDNLGWTGKRAEDMTKDDGVSNKPEDDLDSEK